MLDLIACVVRVPGVRARLGLPVILVKIAEISRRNKKNRNDRGKETYIGRKSGRVEDEGYSGREDS